MDKWYREFTNIVLNAIKLMKYADISVDRLEAYLDQGQATIMKIIGPIYKNYQTILDQEGYFDYDDILIRAYRILVENESVAENTRPGMLMYLRMNARILMKSRARL